MQGAGENCQTPILHNILPNHVIEYFLNPNISTFLKALGLHLSSMVEFNYVKGKGEVITFFLLQSQETNEVFMNSTNFPNL